eukprot:gnl/TRDRNA2_/TRDRNA2_139563_c1_seq1.p3 gnl/TRDRNA2_/TRDRNA2_139563_c1~~gnl/TRDRNA2_/TRDRNA2_139563_c1_seq1.p3  ORF type:complete len:106 (-),score=24.62 gnl/TRDRNA2_/TRDRNA2_139563_c1_seq1:335-652(-)
MCCAARGTAEEDAEAVPGAAGAWTPGEGVENNARDMPVPTAEDAEGVVASIGCLGDGMSSGNADEAARGKHASGDPAPAVTCNWSALASGGEQDALFEGRVVGTT